MSARASSERLRRSTALLAALLLAGALPLRAQQHQLLAEWGRNVTEFRGQVGRRITLVCPPNGQVGSVWGTDVYTDDSPVCPAAVHAGLITPSSGGIVTIVIEPAAASYAASTRNGVSSQPFGQWQGGFSFARSGEGRIDWGTTSHGLTPQLGRAVTLECPPSGLTGRIYGTDTYTDDSSICSAAVHAGIITAAAGGRVTIEGVGEQASFAASARNGVVSQEYGSWPNAFRFSGTAVAAAAPAPAPALPAASSGETVTGAPVATTPAASTPEPSSAPASTSPATQPAASTPPAAIAAPATPAATPAATQPAGATPTTRTVMSGRNVTPPVTPSAASPAAPASPNVAVSSAAVAKAGPVPQVTNDKTAMADADAAASAPLAAPSGLTVTPLGDGQVLLRWNPLPGAAVYHARYHQVGETVWYALTDRQGDPLPTGTSYQSDPQLVVLPAGTLEFAVSAGRDTADRMGAFSAPVRATIPRYHGRYRVTLNGFRVNRETIDSPLNYDGQHDEIYVRVGVREYDGDGNAIGNEQVPQTHTHGDINATRWKQQGPAFRYIAGTAAGFGGLKTGDGFPNPSAPWALERPVGNATFPLFVWEGYLREGHNAVAIMPVIYEDDESMWELKPETQGLLDIGLWVAARGQEQVQNLAGQYKPTVRRKLALAPDIATLQSFGGMAGSMNTQVFGKAAATWLYRQQQLNQRFGPMLANLTAASSLILNTKDRPIGLAGIDGGKLQFNPRIVRLSFESAEKFLASKQTSNPSIPAGIIEVRYQDTIPGGNGDYTLYLQITRVQ